MGASYAPKSLYILTQKNTFTRRLRHIAIITIDLQMCINIHLCKCIKKYVTHFFSQFGLFHVAYSINPLEISHILLYSRIFYYIFPVLQTQIWKMLILNKRTGKS